MRLPALMLTAAGVIVGAALVAVAASAEPALGPPPFAVPGGRLKLEFCADDIVRVAYAPSDRADAFFARPTLMTAAKRCRPTAWKLSEDKRGATIATAKLQVHVDLGSGKISFADAAGRPILTERGRALEPANVMGESTFHVSQQWEPAAGESLYGLGQHQQGLLDLKDIDLDLHQVNGEIFIPFLVSSRGYGLLWDNTSLTRFGDLGEAVPLPVPETAGLYAAGVRAGSGDVALSARGTVDWSGTVTAPATGDYLFRAYSSGAIKLTVDGRVVVDHFRQGWLAAEDLARVSLRAGQRVPIKVELAEQTGWRSPSRGEPTSASRSSSCSGSRRSPTGPPRSGRRSETASTTPSSTVPGSTG